jgi:hypothetical protein
LVGLDEMNFHFAVHDERTFVVRSGEPGGVAFSAQGFDHVVEIHPDADLFVRFRLRRNLENVRENVVLRIVVDDLHAAFSIVLQRPELCMVVHHRFTLANGRASRLQKSAALSRNMTWVHLYGSMGTILP